MISMAAGLAYSGLSPWCYSIAPFVAFRPFEQIRNDVCLHDLPVKLVGNGGGYGYGPMGSTHHAIEDYGTLLALQHMHCYIPAFDMDVEPCLIRMHASKHPSYLRLGRQEHDPGLLPYSPWRQLVHGISHPMKRKPVIIAVGPIAGALMAELTVKRYSSPTSVWHSPTAALARPTLWVISELPFAHVPNELIRQMQGNTVIVVEEHVEQGSFGQQLAYYLAKNSIDITAFKHYCARGYTSGRYGSQQFHRNEFGINAEEICKS